METLNLRFVSQDPFALVLNANGTMVRVACLGFDVTDIRQEVTALQEKGIVCERYPGMRQDEIGIWHSPNGALVA